jgi:F-type H+-transporting ATPase subunit epsilon
MYVELITSEGSAYSGDAVSVTIPSGDGEITVLDHHLPLLSTVQPGTVIIRTKEEELYFAVSRGVVQVASTNIRILSDIADRADGLEEQAITLAKARAEELRENRRNDAEGFAEATATLERELARLMSIRRLRSRRSHRS